MIDSLGFRPEDLMRSESAEPVLINSFASDSKACFTGSMK